MYPRLLAAGVAICLASIGAVAAQTPSEDRGVVQAAFARWDQGSGVLLTEGYRSIEQDLTMGTLATLGCGPSACIGAAFTKKLPAEAFMVDPTLSEGALSIRWDRRDHVIGWNGEGEPTVVVGDPNDPGVGAERDATAEGKVFGREVASDDIATAYLAQGDGDDKDQEPGTYRGIVLGAPLRTSGDGDGDLGIATNNDRCIGYKRSEKRFARLINKERSTRDQNRLRLDTELGKVARKHTAEMIDRTLLYHTPSADLAKRVTNWRVLGENVGYGGGVATLHTAFMNSPAHKENVLYPTYRHVGVGVKKVAGVMWVTVIFEARKNPGTTLRCD